MSEPSLGPNRVGSLSAIGIGLLALGAGAPYSALSLLIAAPGLALFAVGALTGRRGAVSFGAIVLFLGIVAAGADGAPVVAVLVGVTATVLAWDLGEHSIGLGEQLGRDADATRNVAVHAVVSLAVGVAAVGGSYSVYSIAGGGLPLTTLILLLLAAIALTAALRP